METANTNTTASGTMTGTTANFNQWSNASFIRSQVVGESVEFIYSQYQLVTFSTGFYNLPAETRVFKIVFSCVNGKWNVSEPIYGKVIPAQEEDYDFF